MTTTHVRPPVRLLLLAAFIAIAVFLAGQFPERARAERPAGWLAGEASEQRVPVAASVAAAAGDRAGALARALGMAGQPGRASRLFNRVEARTVDEVDLFDATGRRTAHFKLDAATGAIRSAVHLDWRAAFDAQLVDAASAPRHAARTAAAAGVVVPTGAPSVSWDDGMTAWHVRWSRSIGGVPADGGTSIWLFRGGQVKAIGIAEPAASPAPLTAVSAADATAVVRGYIRQNNLERFRGLTLDEPRLRWVAGNDFVATDKPDAPEPTLSLAWVVRFRYEVPGWRLPHEVELYVDAGSGVLIGGAETA